MPEHLQFCFELDEIADIKPWGAPGLARLHWFGLTSGHYWIQTPTGEVLRYTAEIQRFWGRHSPWVDYQVARLLEDLEECLPNVLEPVPEDIAAVVSDSGWLSSAMHWKEQEIANPERDARWDLYDAAVRWWHDREIDTAYLIHGPRLSFWRVGDHIHFKWKVENNQEGSRQVFLVPRGHCRTEAALFQTEAYAFCDAVLLAMRRRTEQIQQEGWQRTDCALDIGELISEQRRRMACVSELRGRLSVTDWDRVRMHLTELCQSMDRSD